MNIKKSQLTELIKAVVRESIQERKDKWIQKAVDPEHKGYCTPMTKKTCTPRRKALAMRFKKGDIHKDNVKEGGYEEQVGGGVVAEKAPPGFGPDKAHSDIYNKVLKQYPNDPEKAYATMWSIHNKMEEAKNAALEECGCGMDEAGLTSEHDDAGHEEEEMKLVKVLKHVAGKLHDMHKGMDECMDEEGKAQKGAWTQNMEEIMAMCEEYLNEASYKVVSQTQAQTQKDDQAKKVQVEPKVNETAYKTQGPSYRTFKDSPQLPPAVNNPKTA